MIGVYRLWTCREAGERALWTKNMPFAFMFSSTFVKIIHNHKQFWFVGGGDHIEVGATWQHATLLWAVDGVYRLWTRQAGEGPHRRRGQDARHLYLHFPSQRCDIVAQLQTVFVRRWGG